MGNPGLYGKHVKPAWVKVTCLMVFWAYVSTASGVSAPSWKAFLEQQRAIMQAQCFELEVTLEDSLDGQFQHGVVMWSWSDDFAGCDYASSKGEILEVYEIQTLPDGGVQVERIGKIGGEDEVYRYVYFADHNLQDVNGDGLKELVIDAGTGGSCRACNTVRIFQVSQRRLKELSIEGIIVPKSFDDLDKGIIVPQSLADLDGDGLAEVIARDDSWSYLGGACTACAPELEVIYAWQHGQYVKASHRFPQFYEAKIAQLEQKLQSTAKYDESYLTDAVSLFLNYNQKGDKERGWQRFQTLINSHFKTPDDYWAEIAREITVELKTRFQLESSPQGQ